MTKNEFLKALRKRLSNMPKEDIEKSLEYYEEIIEDRIDEGISEEQAVSDLGSIENIENEIISNTSLSKLVIQKIKPKRKMSTVEIVLLAIGSPIWLALIISLFAVFISVYAVLISLVISFYAITISLLACSVVGIFETLLSIIKANYSMAGIFLSAILVCAGLGIFAVYLSKIITKLTFKLSKFILIKTKRLFLKKEESYE